MSLDRREFADVVMEFLRAEGEGRPLRYDERTFHVIAGDNEGPTSFAYLGHAFNEYTEANGENGPRILRRRLWSMVRRATPPTKEQLFKAIVPRMRDRAWFSAVRRQAEYELGPEDPNIEELLLPHKALNDDLAAHLAFELPTSVSELSGERLSTWATSFESLFGLAITNLRERSLEGFEEAEPGVFISPFRDTLDATRMLLIDDIAELPVKGAPIAIAPTHDTLFITGEDDAQGLQTIAAWAEEALLEPRSHTAVAFKLLNGQWEAWLPPMKHPAWSKLKMLQLQTLASAYSRQKEVLESVFEANGTETFVATMRAFRVPGEGPRPIFTACAWTEGVDALLPQTDRLDLVRMPPDGSPNQNAKVWSTSWEVAQRHVGHLMKPTGDLPARWHVTAFPDDATLEKLALEGKL